MNTNKKQPVDNYIQYMFGWHHGAGRKGMVPERAEHKDKEFAALYVEGYEDGQQAGRDAAAKATERFGYTPSIVRAI
jgi:hypothetical protein